MNKFALSTASLIVAVTIAGCGQPASTPTHEWHVVEVTETPETIATDAILTTVETLVAPHASIGTKGHLIDGPLPQDVPKVDQMLRQKYIECDNGRTAYWISGTDLVNDTTATATIGARCRAEADWHKEPALTFVHSEGEWKITRASLDLLLSLYAKVKHP